MKLLKKFKIFLICILMLNTVNLSSAGTCFVGTTFSQVQCEYFGLDWKETYEEVLKMGFCIIRLGAYWSRIESKEGEFDFSELDWQIKKASEKGIKVLLTVGMKAPRWPEFFIPQWADERIHFRFGSDVSDNDYLRDKVLNFVSKVAEHYKNNDTIAAWQVENEPLNRSGPKELWVGRKLLQEEIDLVKKIDGYKKPIVLNSMTYPNRFLRFFTRFMYKRNPVFQMIDMAEIPALNVYPVVGHKLWGAKICFWSSTDGRSNYLKPFIKRAEAEHKTMWITELQAEPWEPGELVHMFEAAPITCGPEVFMQTFRELRSLNIDTIFLWGVEYWLYRAKTFKDVDWLEAGKHIIKHGL